jgi:hypothetical protein
MQGISRCPVSGAFPETEAAGGGCPFIKRNDQGDPPLSPLEEFWDTRFLSLYSSMIETTSQLSPFKKKKSNPPIAISISHQNCVQ